MTSFGDRRDNDGIDLGDNLYGAPDPGFETGNAKPASRAASIGIGGVTLLYAMALFLAPPVLSLVPFIWAVCIAMFWTGVAAFVVTGLRANTRRPDRLNTVLVSVFAGCAALLPLVWIASVIRAMSGR